MKSKKKLIIMPEATHLFEEPGKLEQVYNMLAIGSYDIWGILYDVQR